MRSILLFVALSLFLSCKPKQPEELSYKLDATTMEQTSNMKVKQGAVVKFTMASNSLCPSHYAWMEMKLNNKTIKTLSLEAAPDSIAFELEMPESGDLVVYSSLKQAKTQDVCIWLGEVYCKILY